MTSPMPPRDAPRCPRCGILLPLHMAGCPELTPLSSPEFDPLFETPQVRDELPGRPGYEVTQRSRFDEEGHDDCDCASCRPWTS